MSSNCFKLLSSAFLATLSTSLIAAFPAQAASFRVNPYLQQPSSDGMYFTWFSEENVTGTLTINGADLA
ncbi:MAG: metallophosphoesterase, partial [Cyanobacteria bacterium J06555_13]